MTHRGVRATIFLTTGAEERLPVQQPGPLAGSAGSSPSCTQRRDRSPWDSSNRQRKALAAALTDLNASHRGAPDNSQVCNNLAWMLATCSDGQLRDDPRAVALARQACQATGWKHPYCLGTLGAALAETGAFEEAIHWQSQAIPLYAADEKLAGRARLERYEAGQPHREP